MLTESWGTSPRRYEIELERNVTVPVRGGIKLIADVFRPRSAGKFPALLMISPYDRAPFPAWTGARWKWATSISTCGAGMRS
jgi:predicted acyl esterase